jgi:hypothetical protein
MKYKKTRKRQFGGEKMSIPQAMVSAIFLKFLKNLDLSVDDFNSENLKKIEMQLQDPKVIEQIKYIISKLYSVAGPSLEILANKFAVIFNESLKNIQGSLGKTIITAVPVVGPVIDEIDNANRIVDSGVKGVANAVDITSNVLENLNKKVSENNLYELQGGFLIKNKSMKRMQTGGKMKKLENIKNNLKILF